MTSSADSGIGSVGPTEDVEGRIARVTKLVDHTGGNVCREEPVKGERLKEVAGWINGCISMELSWDWGVAESNVGRGVVDSNVGRVWLIAM